MELKDNEKGWSQSDTSIIQGEGNTHRQTGGNYNDNKRQRQLQRKSDKLTWTTEKTNRERDKYIHQSSLGTNMFVGVCVKEISQVV
jgi:hypothetical protein